MEGILVPRQSNTLTMTSLSHFLTQHKRSRNSCHTHTWFGGKSTQTLTIVSEDVFKLRELVLQDAQQIPNPSCDNPRSITEKVTRGKPFPFFADIDFNPADLIQWMHDLDLNPIEFSSNLLQKLRLLVQLFQKVVAAETKMDNIEMIMATRLPYKIHLHFPSIIVDTEGANALASAFDRQLQEQHRDIHKENVVDTSVYSTGLRMLYCHKGTMAKPDKKETEKREHQRLFPTVPYCDVYYVTDIDTWTQNTMPSLIDITRTSIITSGDTALTQIYSAEIVTSKIKTARHRRQGIDEIGSSDPLLDYLAEQFQLNASEIRLQDRFCKDAATIIPTMSKNCPFVSRGHNSNHVYIVVKPTSTELRCHSQRCKGKASLVSTADASTMLSTDSSTTTPIATATKRPPLSVFGDSLNEEFKLPDTEWIDRGLVGRKGSRFHEMTPVSTACLHHRDFQHPLPSLCKLCFREGDLDRMLKVVCPKYGTMDVSGIHYSLLEQHATYIGQLNVTGKIDINVRKEKETILAKLIETLYEAGEQEGLLRDETGFMYRPRFDADGDIVPCSYEKAESHKDFLHRIFSRNPDYHGDPERHTKLEKSLRLTANPKIPFYKTNAHYVGVKNGLVKLWPEPEFIRYSAVTEEMRQSIRVRNYIDYPLEVHGSTKNWDALVAHQIDDELARRYLLAFLGRNLFPIGTDAHECMLFIYGRGKTGKSTVLEAMERMVGSENTSSFMAKGEVRFGLEGKEDKALLRIGDMPSNIEETLPATIFQEMMSGAMLAIARKNKIASDTRWKTPLIAAGNRFPNWENLGDCIARRLAIFVFKRSVMRGDSSVKSMILNQELPLILWRSLNEYHELLYKGLNRGTQMFLDNSPQYFKNTRQLYERSADDLLNFFFSDDSSMLLDEAHPDHDVQYKIDFDEEYRTEYLELLHVFEIWSKKSGRKLTRKDLGKMLPVWDNLGCTFVNRMKVIKPCPTPPCQHAGHTKRVHGQWNRDIILGLQLLSHTVPKTADVNASDDD